jgi:hypothetical protein
MNVVDMTEDELAAAGKLQGAAAALGPDRTAPRAHRELPEWSCWL